MDGAARLGQGEQRAEPDLEPGPPRAGQGAWLGEAREGRAQGPDWLPPFLLAAQAQQVRGARICCLARLPAPAQEGLGAEPAPPPGVHAPYQVGPHRPQVTPMPNTP